MRNSTGFKKTVQYKKIRKIFVNLFGQPDYSDHIVNGVSFKWYVDKLPSEIRNQKNIKKFVESMIPKYVFPEVKLIKNTMSTYNPRRNSDSLRVLIRE